MKRRTRMCQKVWLTELKQKIAKQEGDHGNQ